MKTPVSCTGYKSEVKKMEDLKIRSAVPGDLPAIQEIDLRAWNEMSMAYLMEQRYGQLGDQPANVLKARWSQEMFARNMSNLLVAELAGQVVGYADFALDEERQVGTVGYNAVDPEYRGRGIGTVLQRRVRDLLRARGMRYAHVTTMMHDQAARRVYEKMGFEEIARSIHYSMRLEDGAAPDTEPGNETLRERADTGCSEEA